MDKIIDKFIDSIEKIFRYLIPGIAFIFCNELFYNLGDKFEWMKTENIGNQKFWIFIFLMGLVIYSLHRLFFEYIDFICPPFISFILRKLAEKYKIGMKIKNWLSKEIEKNANYTIKSRGKKVIEYLDYKMSMVHLWLILSELFFFFIIISNLKSKFYNYREYSIKISVLMWALSLIYYLYMHKLQTKILEFLPNPE